MSDEYTVNSYKEKLDRMESVYNNQISQLALSIYEHLVVGFCKQYRVVFTCGMGSFRFWTRKTKGKKPKQLNTPEEDLRTYAPHFRHKGPKWEAYIHMYEVLDLVPGGWNFSIGCYMPDYPMKKKEKKNGKNK